MLELQEKTCEGILSNDFLKSPRKQPVLNTLTPRSAMSKDIHVQIA